MSQALRVLHVYKDYPPVLGGIEKHIHTLAHLQARQGFRVTVLVTNPARFPHCLRTHTTVEGPVRVIRAGRLLTTASTPISPQQALYQMRLDADIVHLHFPYPPGEIANLLRRRPTPTVMTYHSDVVRQQRILRVYRPLLHRVLTRTDAIIATSPRYAETSPYLQRVRSRVHPIPLGIDLTPFLHTDPARARELRRQGLPAHVDVPLVLFVGRLRYYKGVDVLLRAIAALKDVHLWIVGTGPMEARWRELARRLALDARVRFWGEVPEERLPLFYAAADLFVLPATSRAEAFGLVQVEAMASGLPVVSTELGTGTSYVNIHGETGLVVPPGDVEALRVALRELIDQPDTRRRMGQHARERAMREFSAERMGERITALYQQVLRRQKEG